MGYRQMVVARHGGPEVLTLVPQANPPNLEPGSVRLRVFARAAAFTDVLIREGLYPGVPKPPFVPGYGVVGVVDAHRVRFYSITTMKKKQPDWFQADLTTLLHWLEVGRISPIIAQRLPLQAAPIAHSLLDEAAVQGQIVLLCDRNVHSHEA